MATIMNTSNSHNPELVASINKLWETEGKKNLFGIILLRILDDVDEDEFEEKTNSEIPDIPSDTLEIAEIILMNYCDDEDLKKVIEFVETDWLAKAKKYVEEHLLEKVWREKILTSLRAVNEYRCPIDSDITDAINELLNDFGFDNDLPDDWFYLLDDFDDEEDFFWKLDIDYNEEPEPGA